MSSSALRLREEVSCFSSTVSHQPTALCNTRNPKNLVLFNDFHKTVQNIRSLRNRCLSPFLLPFDSGSDRQIDIFGGEERLVHDLLCLRSEAPRPDHALPRQNGAPAANLLSVRETEVLTLIAQGLLNKQIADRLQIGLTTVISHRRNIMQKLGVQSVAALVICAVSMGYVDESDIRTPHK